jgi:hypothetical protein
MLWRHNKNVILEETSKMKKIEMKWKGGTINLEPPKSLATCLDFVSCWGSEQNRSKLSRLCAAAIAVGAPSGNGFPTYDITQADPYSYGHGAANALLENGIGPGVIFEKGTQLLALMAQRIPTGGELDETVNFTKEGGTD